MKFSLIGLFPNIAFSKEVQSYQIRVCIGILDSLYKFAANANDDIFLESLRNFNVKVTYPCFINGNLTHKIVIGCVVTNFYNPFFFLTELLRV